jgi:hypothetical protein
LYLLLRSKSIGQYYHCQALPRVRQGLEGAWQGIRIIITIIYLYIAKVTKVIEKQYYENFQATG